MKKTFVLVSLVLLVFGLILAGCPSRKVVQPEIEQRPTVTPKETTQKAAEVKPEEKITEQRFAKIETKEETPKYIEERGLFGDIQFDYDKYDIRPDAKPILQNVASWLIKNTSAKILVEGHCDERGTNEYNLALGDRRAKAARDYLIALGIASNRIEMLSYGEEKPLCKESTEECWTKNRRVHFVILKEAGK
jgi:peptidoglycan-associated lipoprotein